MWEAFPHSTNRLLDIFWMKFENIKKQKQLNHFILIRKNGSIHQSEMECLNSHTIIWLLILDIPQRLLGSRTMLQVIKLLMRLFQRSILSSLGLFLFYDNNRKIYVQWLFLWINDFIETFILLGLDRCFIFCHKSKS